MVNILVTGGAGFIGSSFVNLSVKKGYNVIVLDKLTYCGTMENLIWIKNFSIEEQFVCGDIADRELVLKTLFNYKIDWVVNFAAETHVDNSIDEPTPFIETNVSGVFHLLCSSLKYYKSLSDTKKKQFRFLHISTDEVYGELLEEGMFAESSPYCPSSPYSASKAASDHFVRAWNKTYGLPTLITNCSNNFGPRQHNEKLIPAMIDRAFRKMPMTIYGEGKNIRDWIFVDDHNEAVLLVLTKGKVGQTYCIGANNEKNNNEIVHLLCEKLDQFLPIENRSYRDLVTYIKDRPGHDKRYAINADKIKKELGFIPKFTFNEAIEITIKWYIHQLEKEKDERYFASRR